MAPGRGGSGGASGWPCAMSCCCLLRSAVRSQPGTAHVTCWSSRLSSRDWQAAQSCLGAGRSEAKASSWAAAVQVQAPEQPGRSHLRSTSCTRRDFSRHGSHIPSDAEAASPRARPRPSALFDSWRNVRVHPGTRQGRDLAPSRSASVNVPAAMRSFVWWQYRTRKASGNSARTRAGDTAHKFRCFRLTSGACSLFLGARHATDD